MTMTIKVDLCFSMSLHILTILCTRTQSLLNLALDHNSFALQTVYLADICETEASLSTHQ